jgi:glycosyltransferase involved in cell wall biosynthesis
MITGSEKAAPAADHRLDLTIVMPVFNEVENLDPAVTEVLETLDGMPERSELIIVDDGSRDGTVRRARRWHERDARVRVIEFRRNFGQTAAISAGFHHARGDVVVVMDGDQQNDPRDIPRLLDRMRDGFDVVSGWRLNRKDKLLLRRIPSKLANRLISRVTGTRLHDYGCTLKAYDADVVRYLHLYGELHRFIPALAAMVGAEVTEIPVNHRARLRGSSKYGISRTVRVLLDLMTIKFLSKYVARPMQFFGLPGLFSFVGGIAILAYLFIERVGLGHGVSDRPLLTGSILMTILGVQFISLGLLGELLTRIYFENGERKPYVIREMVGFDEPELYVIGENGAPRFSTATGRLEAAVTNGQQEAEHQVSGGQRQTTPS